jgi:hypothetical protein
MLDCSGVVKAPLSASEIEEENKKGEWQVVYVEIGARGTKNSLELVRSLRLVGMYHSLISHMLDTCDLLSQTSSCLTK